MYKNALIIVNPASGGGVAKDTIDNIKKVANQLGWQGEIVETTKQETAENIANKYIKKGIHHIIIGGGDGSVREVLNAILNKNVLLGIIPLGTGNVYSKDLGIPQSLEEALNVALYGKPTLVDVGIANGKLFNLVAGIGIDADVMKKTTKTMKDRYGIIAYMLNTFKQISKPSRKYKITIDNKKPFIWRASAILVANIGKTAIGLQFAPGATPTSGDFRVAILRIRSFFQLFIIAFRTLVGIIENTQNYIVMEAKKVEIESLSRPVAFECDGDAFPPTKKLDISIFARSIAVLVPNN